MEEYPKSNGLDNYLNDDQKKRAHEWVGKYKNKKINDFITGNEFYDK